MKTSMSSKQRRRMMSYFINAAHEIMEGEGLEALTVRKVADLAGYNSATLYNYFINLDHLLMYASIKDLKDYYLSLDDYIKSARNSYERFLLIWEDYCFHAYKRPEIFKLIFFSEQSISDIYTEYFKIFPSDFGEHSPLTLSMLSDHNFYHRNKKILEPLTFEGHLESSDLDEANDMIISLYRGILDLIIDRKKFEEIDLEKEVKKTVGYIERILRSYRPNIT